MSTTTGAGDPPSRREHLTLLGVWALIAAWTVSGAFGRIVPETKLELTWAPIRFLGRASSAWDPSAAFGGLQNQAIGYLFPMGLVTSVLRGVGLPVWLTQRLWVALLLGAAATGMHRLVTRLGVSTAAGRLSAATAYALAPSLLLVVSYHAGTALPHALAPWMLIPLLDHRRLGARRAASLSALAVAAMGGINAASTVAVLPAALLWFLTRRPGDDRRRLFIWWIAGLAAATAWWALPFLVSVRHGFDFTPFTERAWLTASTQSATDAWRGTGHWLTYIDQGGRVLQPGAQGLVLDGRAIAGSLTLLIVGVLGLGRRDAPGRRWLVPTAVLGGLALAAAYTGPGNSGPIAASIRDLLDGPLVAFRNLSKFSPLVQLPLAVGIGHLVAVAGRDMVRLHRSPTSPAFAPRVLPVVVPLAVLASIAPVLPGRLFLPGSFADLPDAWYEAANWVDERPDDTRTLVLPGAISADHLWGHPQDEPLALLSDLPHAVRDIIPLGGNGSTRLLDGIDEALRRGNAPVGLGSALRRAGIGRIVVRNDLIADGDGAPSPETVRRTLTDVPELTAGPSFGPALDPAELIADDLVAPTAPSGDAAPIRQIDTYLVTDPVERIAVSDLDATLAVGGGPEAALVLPPELIEHRAWVLADDRADLPMDLTVTTDTARHRDVLFGGIRSNASPTLLADDPGPLTGGEPEERWPDATPPPRTVAVLRGAASLTESGPARLRPPGSQPFAVFDQDPETVWVPNGHPLGAHLEVRFDRARPIPGATVTIPSSAGRRIAAVSVTTDGAEETATIDADGVGRVDLGSAPTSFVRITITALTDGADVHPVGLSSVELADTPISRPLRTAPPSSDGVEPAEAAVLDRSRVGIGSVWGMDEDGVLDRIVTLTPGPRHVTGEASAVGGAALDRLLREAAALPAGASTASVAETGLDAVVTGPAWSRLPGHGPDAAFDGDPDTFWATEPAVPGEPAGDPAEIRWSTTRSITSFTIGFTGHRAAADPADVEVTVRAGDTVARHRPGAAGRIRVDPTVTDSVTIDVRADGASTGRPVTISRITVDDGPPLLEPVDPSTPISLPCGEGPALTIDDRVVPTSLSTTVGAVRSGRPARWEACGPIRPEGTETRITAVRSEPFRIDTAVVSPANPAAGSADSAGSVGSDRRVEIVSWEAGERRVEVGSGSAVVLAGTENADGGWHAGGAEGLRTIRVDGWRQALLVPSSPEDLRIHSTYGPNRPFRLGLALGLILLAALAASAAIGRRHPDEAPTGSRRLDDQGDRAPSLMGAMLLAAIVGVTLGGATVIALVPLVIVQRHRPRLLRWVTAGALAIVGLLLLAPLGARWASTNAAFRLPAQIAAVIAWMSLALGTADPPGSPAEDSPGEPRPS